MNVKKCFDLGKVTFTDEELEAPYEEENNMETYKQRMVKEYQEVN